MYFMQIIQVKKASSWSLQKTPPPKKMIFYDYPTISWGYGNGSLPQKEDDL